MNNRILLVDDEEELLDILSEFLIEKGYVVSCAINAARALEWLDAHEVDLVVSDINMPGMKGFDLLARIEELRPKVKRALITAYDVRDYLQLAKDHNVGNIITKTAPFNFDEVELLIKNILTEDVFGLERYVDGPVQNMVLTKASDIDECIMTIIGEMPEPRMKKKFRQALGEILVNAVFYGAKNEKGDRKHEWDFNAALQKDEEVVVSWSVDSEKAGVSVHDQKGRLSKKDAIYWIERNASRNADGLSQGIYDEHGKGLYITQETIDRFIVNIKRNVTTETVMLVYKEGLYNGYRPLWIHEF